MSGSPRSASGTVLRSIHAIAVSEAGWRAGLAAFGVERPPVQRLSQLGGLGGSALGGQQRGGGRGEGVGDGPPRVRRHLVPLHVHVCAGELVPGHVVLRLLVVAFVLARRRQREPGDHVERLALAGGGLELRLVAVGERLGPEGGVTHLARNCPAHLVGASLGAVDDPGLPDPDVVGQPPLAVAAGRGGGGLAVHATSWVASHASRSRRRMRRPPLGRRMQRGPRRFWRQS